MAVRELPGDDDAVASPIVHDDLSVSQLDMTQLSLPESFDESLCLDVYTDILRPNRTGSGTIYDRVDGSRGCTRSKMPHGIDRNELKSNARLTATSAPKPKGRDDSRKETSSEYESEVDTLQSELHQQKLLHHHGLQSQIDELEEKVHLMGTDLARARNDAGLFQRRAEIAEKQRERSASECDVSKKKVDEERLRTIAEKKELNSQYERDLIRIREDCALEIASSRNHQNEAFARESQLLCTARDQAIEQSKRLQQELSELRKDRETKEAENSDIIKELERQLADVRSDLKVKLFELNSLMASHERTTLEATKSKSELTKCKVALAKLQEEFSGLQVRSAKLEEANRQKDDALKVYHHEDLLVDCGTVNITLNNDNQLNDRRSLVKNSVALARKCRELQSLMKTQSSELSIEHEKNESLARKLESSQQLFKQLSTQNNRNAAAYIISTVQARDNEILKLHSKITSLESKLMMAAQARDNLSTELSKVLERRDQLDEMKALVEAMKHKSMSCVRPMCGINVHAAATKVESYDALENDDDDEDLLEHTVHHSCLKPNWKQIL